jgi:hypothetical protein
LKKLKKKGQYTLLLHKSVAKDDKDDNDDGTHHAQSSSLSSKHNFPPKAVEIKLYKPQPNTTPCRLRTQFAAEIAKH